MPKKVLTDEDIQLLYDTFAAKDDLQRLEKKIDLLPTKEMFLSEMAKLMQEIKDGREEVIIVAGYKDRIEDHDDRISHLETHLHA